MTPEETLAACGASRAARVNPSRIPVDLRFRDACRQNRCGCFGTNWSCPPAEPEDAFVPHVRAAKDAFVFQLSRPLSDPLDLEGMRRAEDEFLQLCRNAAKSFPQAMIYGTGPCQICTECAYPDPCRFPDLRERNLEAACVDVTALCSLAGLPYADEGPSVTYTGLILIPFKR